MRKGTPDEALSLEEEQLVGIGVFGFQGKRASNLKKAAAFERMYDFIWGRKPRRRNPKGGTRVK